MGGGLEASTWSDDTIRGGCYRSLGGPVVSTLGITSLMGGSSLMGWVSQGLEPASVGTQSKRKAGGTAVQLHPRARVSTWLGRNATVNSKAVLPAVNSGPPNWTKSITLTLGFVLVP